MVTENIQKNATVLKNIISIKGNFDKEDSTFYYIISVVKSIQVHSFSFDYHKIGKLTFHAIIDI